jgi:glycosyltransferase involved in cell wall biosynthesis
MEIIHVLVGKANPRGLEASNSLVNELATQQALAKENISVWGIDRSPVHDYPWRPFSTLLFRKCLNPFHLDSKLTEALGNIKGNAVFHLHGGWNSFFYTLVKALHRRNIPFVFTPQDCYPVIAFQKGQWTRKIYFQLFEKRILKYARYIHCLNKIEKEALQIIYPNKKTMLIPYGYEGFTKIKHDNYSREFVIGFCGQLDIHSKGLDLLLRAFSLFNRQVPLSELWIMGDGPDRTKLEELAAELGIARHMSFWGQQTDEEKLGLLQQMQVFAYPSRIEGIPLEVLEAASTGIPCVVTKLTHIGDFIRQYNCGEVIDQPDHEALFDALKKVYTSIRQNGRSAMSENAQRMIREIFNWKTILQQFHRLYKRA